MEKQVEKMKYTKIILDNYFCLYVDANKIDYNMKNF